MTLIALTRGRIENNFYKLLNINSDFSTRKLYLDINNYRLLIVEVEHDSYNTYGDKYYTYASIEVKYEKN